MASLADIYSAGSSMQPLAFSLGDLDIAGENAREDAGLSQSDAATMYGRGLTNLVNQFSGMGTVRGGMAGVAADQMRQDYDTGQANTTRLLDRTLSNLARNKVLATYGMMF